jgi:hypothetical protein
MTDAAADAIMAAIHSAFESYPKEGDPDWRKPQLDHAGGMRASDQSNNTRVGSQRLPDREEETRRSAMRV